MKDCIPTEEDFELLLEALISYEKVMATEILVKDALSRIDLKEVSENAEAFEQAFSNPSKSMKPMDVQKVIAETREMRDKITLASAKLIELRKHVRSLGDRRAVDELLS